MIVNSSDIQKIALGSLILGGGGGGNVQEGLETADKALQLDQVELLSLSDISDRDGVVLTISGVGSPASETAFYSDEVYEKILQLVQTQLKQDIIGFIPCEMGGSSSFEPFIPAALLKLPLINSACDGRAHPFGIMGSLGLGKGTVSKYTLQTENALDHGHFVIDTCDGLCKMYFFNEYMALERDGIRLHTFPDLLLTVYAATGQVLSTAEIDEGREVIIFAAPKEKLRLGKGLRYRSTYRRIEEILKIDMQVYVEDLFLD